MTLRIADKTENAARIEPKDVLSMAVADLDKYEFNRAIVILARHEVGPDGDEGSSITHYVGGIGSNNYELIGLLEEAKLKLIQDVEQLYHKEINQKEKL